VVTTSDIWIRRFGIYLVAEDGGGVA